jgi:hypothetical protein
MRSNARCRSAGMVSRQAAKPCSAASIAAAMSGPAETAACAWASPVHGSTTGEVLVSAGSTYDPSTKLRSTGNAPSTSRTSGSAATNV